MIKIAFVINTIYSPTGGTEKQLLLLLKNLDRGRFLPVLCVLYKSEWLKKEFDLCPVYEIGIRSYKNPACLYRLWQFVRFIKSENFNIVQTLFQDGMRVGILAGKLAKAPAIIAVRRNQGYWMTRLDRVVFGILNRWVTLFIANSNSTRKWASEFECIPEDKIHVVHNGLQLEPFDSAKTQSRRKLREEFSIPESAQVVGIVANLRPVKAVDVFIRAAKKVSVEIPSAHFVIVGCGDLEGPLRFLAESLGISACVHFLGERRDIVEVLSVFDLGVLSSSSESFSNSIVEYLASGLPVVCTDVGGAREAVIDDVNGFVVGVGDFEAMAGRITTILKTGLVTQMGMQSKIFAGRNFSLAAMIEKHEQLYGNF